MYVVGDLKYDKAYLKEIRDLISNFKLLEKAVFLGEIDHERIKDLYPLSDVFVSSSLHEAFGLSILQADTFGLPVIDFATGGVKEIVNDGLTGILVPLGNLKAFSKAVEVLIRNRQLKNFMGIEA